MTSSNHNVTFKNGDIDVAGSLWLPDDLEEGVRLPAVVLSTPGSSVKEQIGANYARRLADRGFAALAFDPSHQGQSGGALRDLEDPATRIEDFRSGVDLLTTLDYVNEERIGALGICAGGGYAVSATMIDHRIKALGTVVAINIGRAFRQAHDVTENSIDETLVAVGAQRTAEARGGPLRRDPWVPDSPAQAKEGGITDRDVLQAVDYYRTPRGHNEHSTNRLLFRSNAPMLGYDAFNLVDELLTQPVQVILGSRRASTGSYEDGQTLWERSRNKENIFIVNGAGHYEFYDHPEYVDPAVDRLAAFYDKVFIAQIEPRNASDA